MPQPLVTYNDGGSAL